MTRDDVEAVLRALAETWAARARPYPNPDRALAQEVVQRAIARLTVDADFVGEVLERLEVKS